MNTSSCQPADRLPAIRARAILYRHIREFFVQREVLEVETPLLQPAKNSGDPAVMAVQQPVNPQATCRELQTSPAGAMQQLLGSGCTAIYQICKVFRDHTNGQAQSRKHSSEFSMLAWYTLDADLARLMQDIQDLLAHIFGYRIEIEPVSYQEAFKRRLDIDPHQATLKQLMDLARRVGLNVHYGEDRLAWLNVLFSHFVAPTLGYNQPVFLMDCPAKTTTFDTAGNGITRIACFDLYIDGLKLARGEQEQTELQRGSLTDSPFAYGGILLGLDRLLMLLMDKHRIEQVMSLPTGQVLQEA